MCGKIESGQLRPLSSFFCAKGCVGGKRERYAENGWLIKQKQYRVYVVFFETKKGSE